VHLEQRQRRDHAAVTAAFASVEFDPEQLCELDRGHDPRCESLALTRKSDCHR